jgi:hypothetical protein
MRAVIPRFSIVTSPAERSCSGEGRGDQSGIVSGTVTDTALGRAPRWYGTIVTLQ